MDPSWVTAIATTVIALATFISGWIVHTANKRTEHAEKKLQQATERMNWLLGVIGSHSERRLAIAAKQAGIDIRAWDPNHCKSA